MSVVLTADKNGRTDGSAYEMLKKVNSKFPIVLVSWNSDFIFNEKLQDIPRGKYILADFIEYGWDGNNKMDCGEWYKFFYWMTQENVPRISFKREFEKAKQSVDELPIEYPAVNEIPPIQTEEEFNARSIEVFFSWGLSNPIRPKLHGEIWINMDKHGYIVCDNIFNISKFLVEENNPRKWVTLNCPHYGRYDMRNILEINEASKLSVSLFGAGRKCFRHTEASSNSVMVCQEDNFAWTYPWIHGENCLKFKEGDVMIDVLNEFAKRKDLYSIYKKGVETCRKYQIDNYIKHIEATINNAL